MLKIYSNNKEIPLEVYKERLEMKTIDKIKIIFKIFLENPFYLFWALLPVIRQINMEEIAKNGTLSMTRQIGTCSIIVLPMIIGLILNYVWVKYAKIQSVFYGFLDRNEGIKEFNSLKEVCIKNQKKTALILCESSDFRGVTNLTRENTNIQSNAFKFSTFKDLAKDHNLVFHRIESIKSIKEILNSQKSSSIDTLVIHGHGSPKDISLNSSLKDEINNQNIDDKLNFYSNPIINLTLKILNLVFKIFNKDIYAYLGFSSDKLNFKDFSCLKRNSDIILYSCETGDDSKGNSIAKKLSKITNNRKVFAPTISTDAFTYENNGAYFKSSKTKDNITVIYKNGKKVSS